MPIRPVRTNIVLDADLVEEALRQTGLGKPRSRSVGSRGCRAVRDRYPRKQRGSLGSLVGQRARHPLGRSDKRHRRPLIDVVPDPTQFALPDDIGAGTGKCIIEV